MEESLEEALRLKAKELRATLADLQKQDFSYNVEKLKIALPKRKRCTICTLKMPCKHFKSIKDMQRLSVELSPHPRKSQDQMDFSSYIPDFPPGSKKISFMVNIRGREKKLYIDPEVRTTSLPNEKRFNLLCTIEAYREEKLKEEILKLEEAKQTEAEIIKHQQEAELSKQRYLNKQREKLMKYREDLNSRRQDIRSYIEIEKQKKEIKQQKLQKYHENQKKILREYNEQKNGRDGIVIGDEGMALTI